MKYKLLCIMLFVIGLQSIHAQEYDCGWYGKKTVAERNKMFPFNKAKKVVLISYPGGTDFVAKKGDTLTMQERHHIIKKYTFNPGEDYKEKIYLVKEEIQLNEGWVNQLSHLLVNYTLKTKPKGPLLMTYAACYEPRNSILFLDENDAIVCCLEICFECMQSNMWPDPENINQYAQAEDCLIPRLNDLKEIFKKNGITYGIE